MFMRALLVASLATPAFADPPVILQVQAERQGPTWRFDVTLSHPDTGWDHYADAWRILDSNGRELGRRELAHPHESEQPFTRSLSGVEIPATVTDIWIEPRCLVDGWSGTRVHVRLK